MKLRCAAFLILMLILIAGTVCEAEEGVYAPCEYDFSGIVKRTYDSPSLKYTVETFRYEGVECFLSKIWVRDPGKQIRKATAEWEKNIMLPVHIAEQIPEAALVINGSGYVSPVYPWIPEDYPGESKDYFYTPLGSLTVTDGAVYRNLDGVPYFGLTLEEDGLHMYVEADNADVLKADPLQTWSFYVECPMMRNNKIITPEGWSFAGRKARRTVIGRTDRNNYLILSVSSEGGSGLTLQEVNHFFQKHFNLEWLYNLDGGPSSALLCRARGGRKLTTLMGGKAKDADVMAFIELPEE